jgi:hypothetical protein
MLWFDPKFSRIDRENFFQEQEEEAREGRGE